MPVQHSRQMLWRKAWSGVAGAALMLSMSGVSSADEDAQALETGRAEFLSKCAVCHGVDGKGTGPMSSKLKVKPADLTILAKRSDGVFLPGVIYEKIDGRYGARSPSESAMPIWGCRREAAPNPQGKVKPKSLDSLLDLACDSEDRIRARILAVVGYLARIQER
jgi:hypothetical protein